MQSINAFLRFNCSLNLKSLSTILYTFWNDHPSLFLGIMALLGTAMGYHSQLWIFTPFIISFFFLPLIYKEPWIRPKKSHYFLALLCWFFFFFYSQNFPISPPTNLNGLKGTALISFSSARHITTSFGAKWQYTGTLEAFYKPGEEKPLEGITQIPIKVEVSSQQPRKAIDNTYKIEGKIKQKEFGITFSPNAKKDWEIQSTQWTLAEWRFQMKERFQNYIRNQIQNPQVGSFLIGIATGEFDDRLLSREFSRFGLQHIMAISGLHFSILAAALSFFLSLFISTRKASTILLILLSGYFLFIGFSPSILRAWTAITIVLVGLMIERRPSAINSLGVGLLCVLFFNPRWVEHIGFQFSFATTLSILMGFRVCDRLLQRIFYKRHLSQMVDVSLLDKHGYCLLTFLRQSLSLGIVVNLTALPLTLFYFGKFPLMSLLYNMFFPALITVSLILLLIGCASGLVFTPLGAFIHHLNEQYTKYVLNLAFHLPPSWDHTLRYDQISTNSILIYFTLLFFLGMILWKKEEIYDFSS